MIGIPRLDRGFSTILGVKSTKKKRVIVVGLKSHNRSREMLLRLLTLVVSPGDTVLAVHIQEPIDTFNPNTFHIHEDLCKSKQVEFQVKVSAGSSFVAVLTHQAILHSATMLVLGCSRPRPSDFCISSCLKDLPRTCSLLVMDSGGRILVDERGNSQCCSTTEAFQPSLLSSLSIHTSCISGTNLKQQSLKQVLMTTPRSSPRRQVTEKVHDVKKQVLMTTPRSSPRRQVTEKVHDVKKQVLMTTPRSSPRRQVIEKVHDVKRQVLMTTPRSSPRRQIVEKIHDVKESLQFPDTEVQERIQKLGLKESEGTNRLRFTREELEFATDRFSPHLVIGESSHSKVYQANLRSGQAAAVKVLKITEESGEELLQEVEMLSRLNHKNIVQLIGYCYSKDMQAVVYNLLKGSLKQNLTQIRWRERLRVAVGVAKALQYLHHSCSPPIIHRDIKSSNVLLSNNYEPRLSDFGAATVNRQPQQPLATTKPIHVVGTFGYLAPEYMMYGKVDEKIDVYSYGVVLLELITGKEAIQTTKNFKQESLVLWARSLISLGLSDRLIDPDLGKDYDKEEMQRMIFAARLCLMHSSSRRPTITTILKLLDEPEYWAKMRREREEFMKGTSPVGNFNIMDQNGNQILEDSK